MSAFNLPSPASAGLGAYIGKTPTSAEFSALLNGLNDDNIDPALFAGSSQQETNAEQKFEITEQGAVKDGKAQDLNGDFTITPTTLGNMTSMVGQELTNPGATFRQDPVEEAREFTDDDTLMVNPFEQEEESDHSQTSTAFNDFAWTTPESGDVSLTQNEPQQQNWQSSDRTVYPDPQYMYTSPYQTYGMGQNADSSYEQQTFGQQSTFGAEPYAAPYPTMADSQSGRRRSRPAPLHRKSLNDASMSDFPSPSPSPKRKGAGRKKSTRQESMYRAEKPKKDVEKPWVRTNASTKGESTRTGKINEYDPEKDGGYRPTHHPIGDWTGPKSKVKFIYNKEGELRTHKYSVEQINDFLFNHATNANSALTLWVQKTPADCARRYPTQDSSKCCFADCPAKYEHRNILVGHMRVAFDEQWLTHGMTRDPFKVAGYVHLYCLERFCDFPSICRNLNVQADNREFPLEPRGVWGASLGDGRMNQLVKEFISACRFGDDANFPYSFWQQHPQYPMLASRVNARPRGDEAPAFEPNPYDKTLTFALTDAKLRETNNSKRRMMERRGLNDTNILVHVGDLQKLMNAKLKEKERRKSHQHKSATRKVQKRVAARHQEEEEAESSALSEVSEDETPRPALKRPTRKAAGNATRKVQQQSDEEMVDVSSRKRSRRAEPDSGAEDDEDFKPEGREKRRRTVTGMAATASAPVAPMAGGQAAPVNTVAAPSRRADLNDSLYGLPGKSEAFDATMYF